MKNKVILISAFITTAAAAALITWFICKNPSLFTTSANTTNSHTVCGTSVVFSEDVLKDDVTTTAGIVGTPLNIEYPANGFFNLGEAVAENREGEAPGSAVFRLRESAGYDCYILFDIYMRPVTGQKSLEEYLSTFEGGAESQKRVVINDHEYLVEMSEDMHSVILRTILEKYEVYASVMTHNITLKNPEEYLTAMMSRLNHE